MNIDNNYILISTLFSVVSLIVCVVFLLSFLKPKSGMLEKRILLLPLSYLLLEIFFLLQIHSIYWADYQLEIWSGLMGLCSFIFLTFCLEASIKQRLAQEMAVTSEKIAKTQSRIYQKLPLLGVMLFVSVARFLGADKIWPLFGLMQVLGMTILMIIIDGRHYLWHQICYLILLTANLGCRLLPLQESLPALKMLPSIIDPFSVGFLMYIVLKLKVSGGNKNENA